MCYTISRNALYRGEPNMKIILRLRLGAEEILLHWRQEVGALHVTLSIEEKGRWVDLMLQLDGVPYRLTPPSAAETSGVSGVERTLANLGIDWIYQFDHGQNSAYISVEAKDAVCGSSAECFPASADSKLLYHGGRKSEFPFQWKSYRFCRTAVFGHQI